MCWSIGFFESHKDSNYTVIMQKKVNQTKLAIENFKLGVFKEKKVKYYRTKARKRKKNIRWSKKINDEVFFRFFFLV